MKPLLTKVVSARVMSGCGVSGQERLGATRPDGVNWHLVDLPVHDGSLVACIGANPQLSVYAIASELAQGLARRLTGRAIQPA